MGCPTKMKKIHRSV